MTSVWRLGFGVTVFGLRFTENGLRERFTGSVWRLPFADSVLGDRVLGGFYWHFCPTRNPCFALLNNAIQGP